MSSCSSGAATTPPPTRIPLKWRNGSGQSRVDAALSYDSASRDIPLTLTAAPVDIRDGKKALQVDVTVDVSKLSLPVQEGRRTGRLEIQVHCGDVRQAVVGSLIEDVDLKATPDTYANWLKNGFRYVVTVPVSAPASS